jgi:hypothetical protein
MTLLGRASFSREKTYEHLSKECPASAHGLGTCPIGLAVAALNSPQWKKELGAPAELTAIAPIIVGKPVGATPPMPRKPPEILYWK